MTFIPKSIEPFYAVEKEGQKIRLKSDAKTSKGTFLAGSIMTYVRSGYIHKSRVHRESCRIFKDDNSMEELSIPRHSFEEYAELIEGPGSKSEKILYFNHKNIDISPYRKCLPGQIFVIPSTYTDEAVEYYRMEPLCGDFGLTITKDFLDKHFTRVFEAK